MNDFNETAEINEVNETIGTELHSGIPESTFQQLIGASSGQNFVNQFANSGLTFAQAVAAITPLQEQEIVSKFGSDSNFQAFLNGHTTIPVTVVGIVSHDVQHVGHGIQHFG